MKIKSGSFGSGGEAILVRGALIKISGAVTAKYGVADIDAVESDSVTERHFGYIGFIVGAILAAVILFMVAGIVGSMVGVALVAAGSFYKDEDRFIKIEFNDGKWFKAKVRPRESKALLQAADAAGSL